jgi:hypothetical protein
MPAAPIFRFIHLDRVILSCHAIEFYLTMHSISVHILKNYPCLFRFLLFTCLCFLIYVAARGQQAKDSLPKKWLLSAYAETYLVIPTNNSSESKLANFLYNFNRTNAFKFNQAFASADYSGDKFRMQLAVQTGTYVTDNYSGEPAALRPLLKCFIGIPLDVKKDIWLEAGVFPSYIGFENTVAFENQTLTRSLLAENSPYYMSGLRVSHPLGKKSTFSWYLLTGWQRIVPQKNNSLPALGWQWNIRPNEHTTLNWSGFAGSAYPDSSRRWRYFQNLYWQYQLQRWKITAGLDIGLEQSFRASAKYLTWLSPVLIAGYQWNEKWSSAMRLERYHDPHGIIARSDSGIPVVSNGISFNIDYQPLPQLLCRAEWRNLKGNDPIFLATAAGSDRMSFFSFSLSYRLKKSL